LVGCFRYDVDAGVTRPAWLPVAQEPDGAMRLSHLDRLHQREVVRFLEWMRSEDMGSVAAEAYEVVEEEDEVL
jgi:hypothetical protein